VHEILTDPARLAAAKVFILDGLAAGLLKPVIAATFRLSASSTRIAFWSRTNNWARSS
jgi:hypothetical protein